MFIASAPEKGLKANIIGKYDFFRIQFNGNNHQSNKLLEGAH